RTPGSPPENCSAPRRPKANRGERGARLTDPWQPELHLQRHCADRVAALPGQDLAVAVPAGVAGAVLAVVDGGAVAAGIARLLVERFARLRRLAGRPALTGGRHAVRRRGHGVAHVNARVTRRTVDARARVAVGDALREAVRERAHAVLRVALLLAVRAAA